MGIRLYLWDITPAEFCEAFDDPWAVIRRADERYEMDGWTVTGLDKAWGPLQRMFAEMSPPDGELRPAFWLVAGDVSYPYGWEHGYEPMIALIDREKVRDVAADLASIGPADVRSFCRGDRGQPGDEDYLLWALGVAQEFTADAASRGHAVIYLIR